MELGKTGLAVSLALLSLRNAYQIGAKRISNSIVDSIGSNEGYGIANKIMDLGLGSDVTVHPTKMYIAFRRNKGFAF